MDSNAMRETTSHRGNEPSDGVLRFWPCIMIGRVGCLASAQLIESRPGSGADARQVRRNKGSCRAALGPLGVVLASERCRAASDCENKTRTKESDLVCRKTRDFTCKSFCEALHPFSPTNSNDCF